MLSSHHAYLNQFCSFQPHCLLGKYRETQRNKTITSASELCVSACPRHSALCAVASVTPVLAFCHFLAGDLCSSQMGRLAPCKAQLPVLALQETPGPPPLPKRTALHQHYHISHLLTGFQSFFYIAISYFSRAYI